MIFKLYIMNKYNLSLFILLFSNNVLAFNTSIHSPEETVKLLQAGGYIIYFRHGATIHSQQDNDFSDLENCDYQRNLSEKGKLASTIIGVAINRLNIKIANVFTSPFCRTIDTAKLIFNRYKIVFDLRATYATDSEENQRLNAALKRFLSTIPEQGKNTVIVGHTTNLRAITKIRTRPEGAAHIFKPLGNNKYIHIGKITPKQWATLANIQE